MTTETNSSAGDVMPELSNAELDNFFATQGESLNDGEKSEETASTDDQSVGESDQADGESSESSGTEPPEPAKGTIDYNYKKMADEERQRRKEVQSQIDTIKAENEKLKDTFSKVMKSAQEQTEKEQAPSFDDDPLAALKYENDQLKKMIEPLKKSDQDRRQDYEFQEKRNKFINEYRDSADEFKESTPDFDNAYNHLLESRKAEYKAAGYSKEEAAQLLMDDEMSTVIKARQQGVNPAERIYELAKLRGYNNENKASSVSDVKNQMVKNNQKIEQLERGVKASKTLSDSGSNPGDRMTLETIAQMDDDEFQKVDWNKVLKMG